MTNILHYFSKKELSKELTDYFDKSIKVTHIDDLKDIIISSENRYFFYFESLQHEKFIRRLYGGCHNCFVCTPHVIYSGDKRFDFDSWTMRPLEKLT